MPLYEYVCRTCDNHFEMRRSMSDSASPVPCPEGHADTTRLLSVFASVGRAGGNTSMPQTGPSMGGCGAGCACAGGS
jgi:putative FmdB family regulatory protein